MRTSFIAAAGSVVLAVAVATSASAQLVTNGGFETGDFTGWTQFGNTGFFSVDIGGHSGTFGAFFGPVGSTGGITQSIATTIGQTYTFAFWFAPDGSADDEDGISSFEADWGGTPVVALANPLASGFTLYSFDEIATSSMTDISFAFRDDPGFLGLDDVSVNSANSVTPEPATMGLMATGLVGMIGAGYRRKRKA